MRFFRTTAALEERPDGNVVMRNEAEQAAAELMIYRNFFKEIEPALMMAAPTLEGLIQIPLRQDQVIRLVAFINAAKNRPEV